MTPHESLPHAGNPDFIEGIYNYCDRWCERCPATHRCLFFASTQPPDDVQQGTAEEKEYALIRQWEDSYQLTVDLLNKIAAEQIIDPKLISESDNIAVQLASKVDIEVTPLFRLAKNYLDQTHRWMQHSDEAIAAKDAELQQAALLQLPDRHPEQELEELKNALDVLHWYYFQISVKVTRAQRSRTNERMKREISDTSPKDSDGSAKVALIGIERSIGAWRLLLQHLPEQEEIILEILSVLQRLLRLTESEFPGARTFFREGLDEGVRQ